MAGAPKRRARREALAAGKTPPTAPRKPPAAKKKQLTKKATAKKAAARKAPAKPKPPKPSETPRGKGLNTAQRGLRDALMLARQAQGWTWPEIAAEAGVDVSTAKRAVKSRREAMPLALRMDPVKVVEQSFEGFQFSIADFERIAAAAMEEAARPGSSSGWAAVAVSAKGKANEAREKVMALLQATNRLPQNLGDLRHLIDLRGIAQQMLDAVQEFDRAVKAGEDPTVAAEALRATFNGLVGIEDQPRLPAAA